MKRITLSCFLFLTISSSLLAQNWCWGREGAGVMKANDINSAVAVDKLGNPSFTGQYENLMAIGGDSITDAQDEMYVVKFDASGNVLWMRQPKPSPYTSFGTSLATDNENNVYAAGFINGVMSFGSGNASGGYLTKYSPTGVNLWTVQYLGNYNYLTADRYNNIYVGTDNNGIYKYSSNGGLIWSRKFLQPVEGLITDDAGNLYAVGYFNSSVIIGIDTLKSLYQDLFIVKYDTAGVFKWARQSKSVSAASYAQGYGIAIDVADNIYISGLVHDSVVLGANTIISTPTGITGQCNVILAKYNPNGTCMWEKESKDKGIWRGMSLAADIKGHIYLGGSGIGDSLSFGAYTVPLPVHNIDTGYSFITEFDTAGNATDNGVLKNGIAAHFNEYHINIASDSSGSYIYMAGTFFDDTVIAGSDTLLDRNGGTLPYFARWNCGAQLNNEGVNELRDKSEEVIVYPNPNNGLFQLGIRNGNALTSSPNNNSTSNYQVGINNTVEVYNMLGEKVFSKSFSTFHSQLSIDLSSESGGIYLYRVINESGVLTGEGKFVISK
jgi:hypothetical protein